MAQAAGYRLIVCPDADTLAGRAADWIIEASSKWIAEQGRFTLALTGGSTPEKMYSLLSQPERARQIDWKKTFLFVGDERFVPTDDPRSNYGMARRTLLAHVPVPAENVFPVKTRLPRASEAAVDYAQTLQEFFQVVPGQGFPRFDLVLLGMGEDGHCASLFPGMPTLHEKVLWVTDSPPGALPPPVERVTMTFPVLNAAREVLFIVSGSKKAAVAADILEGGAPVEKHPSAGVSPTKGSLVWMIDEQAAALLKRR